MVSAMIENDYTAFWLNETFPASPPSMSADDQNVNVDWLIDDQLLIVVKYAIDIYHSVSHIPSGALCAGFFTEGQSDFWSASSSSCVVRLSPQVDWICYSMIM